MGTKVRVPFALVRVSRLGLKICEYDSARQVSRRSLDHRYRFVFPITRELKFFFFIIFRYISFITLRITVKRTLISRERGLSPRSVRRHPNPLCRQLLYFA